MPLKCVVLQPKIRSGNGSSSEQTGTGKLFRTVEQEGG